MSSENNGKPRGESEQFLSRVTSAIKGKIYLAYSYQAEDTVALDMLVKSAAADTGVFTLDTGKLFPELAAYHMEVEKFFGVSIERLHPDSSEVIELEAGQGEFGMRDSIEARKHCCDIRKVRPLSRLLAGKSAWLTGLRAAQSVTRAGMRLLEYDEQFGLIKINPLVHWSEEDINEYIEKHGLPRNPLYEKGFRSIGCMPCTRPVREGEDIRAGRWWWEDPTQRECGCMVKQGQSKQQGQEPRQHSEKKHERNSATIKLG